MAKILFLGEIGPGQTSLMRLRALERLGHEVRGVHTIEPWIRASWVQRQVQRQLRRGSIVDEINCQALQAAREFHPDLVWAEKQEYLRRQTIEDIRRLGPRLVHFTPDPYFSLDWKRTPLMDEALGGFDVLVYCKMYEQAQYETIGRPLVYMPLGYCDEMHRPLPSDDLRWACAVGFLGGWEPRRERLLHALAAAGADLKIWGGAWDFLRDGRWTPRRQIVLGQLAGADRFHFQRDPLIAAAHQGGEVYADDYARALTGARIGLGFLRTVCEDQHTTRTFEIPACGSMLLADRTEEHREFFKEGKEAVFFESVSELIDKVTFYSESDAERQRIASAGYERCVAGKYAYVYRLREALRKIDLLLGPKFRYP
ncbi:MAG: glycosyltransferase [Hyphomicrobiaceae bacterium]|nr:glycosyltransferase [Hyphomicrobiaceae bacterium]